MFKKTIVIILNFLLNNNFFIKYKLKTIKKINFDNFDFLNFSFENHEDLKNIFFSKHYFSRKFYDEKSINYHTFAWLNTAKKLGGAKIIS